MLIASGAIVFKRSEPQHQILHEHVLQPSYCTLML